MSDNAATPPMTAEERQTSDETRTIADRLRIYEGRVKDALQHLETARPAIKWVLNHWGRTEKELSDHDQSHARLALERVSKAIDGLRGFSVDSSPEARARVRERFGMSAGEPEESPTESKPLRPIRGDTTETRGVKDR